MIYTTDQVICLLQLGEALNLPLYEETTLDDLRVLIKHKRLAETSNPLAWDDELYIKPKGERDHYEESSQKD